MIKVRILKESLHEELLEEAKEDDLYDSYWGQAEYLKKDFHPILSWVYGTEGLEHQPINLMIQIFKAQGSKYAPERQRRIKFLAWATDMHKLGYNTREIVKS